MKAWTRSTAGLMVSLMLLLPRLAEACPMCASQQPGGMARIAALGLMILFPFAIACVVFRALRRASGLSRKGDSTRELSP